MAAALRRRDHIALVLDRAGAQQQLPVCLAGRISECRRHRAAKLGWQTARDNARAQAVYERVGATRDEWVDYWLAVSPGSS